LDRAAKFRTTAANQALYNSGHQQSSSVGGYDPKNHIPITTRIKNETLADKFNAYNPNFYNPFNSSENKASILSNENHEYHRNSELYVSIISNEPLIQTNNKGVSNGNSTYTSAKSSQTLTSCTIKDLIVNDDAQSDQQNINKEMIDRFTYNERIELNEIRRENEIPPKEAIIQEDPPMIEVGDDPIFKLLYKTQNQTASFRTSYRSPQKFDKENNRCKLDLSPYNRILTEVAEKKVSYYISSFK